MAIHSNPTSPATLPAEVEPAAELEAEPSLLELSSGQMTRGASKTHGSLLDASSSATHTTTTSASQTTKEKRRGKKEHDGAQGNARVSRPFLWLLISMHKSVSHNRRYSMLLGAVVATAAVLIGLTSSPAPNLSAASPLAGLSFAPQEVAVAALGRSTTAVKGMATSMEPSTPQPAEAVRVQSVPGGEELQAGAQLEATGRAFEAMAWYRKAALAGSPAAAVRMGAMVEAGMDPEEVREEAPGQWYKLAAQAGLAQGQYELGRWIGQTRHCGSLTWCDSGAGVEGIACTASKAGISPCTRAKIELQMAHWYRKAAEQGHTGAQSALGQLLASGGGGEPGASAKVRDREAVRWLKRAAQAGNATAMVGLAAMMAEGRGGNRDEVGAVRWLTRASQLGSPHAQYNLANMLFSGRGCRKDPGLAAQWYRRAADQGHAQAQSNLGSMLAAGEGGTTNAQMAVQLFRKAAQQGEATAQYNLGNMLFDGRGCAKDEFEAAMWYKSAAEQGYVRAQFAYAVMLSEGRGVAVDTSSAVLFYRQAAEKGLPEAQFNLGYLMATGNGLAKDEQAAARWCRSPPALQHRARLHGSVVWRITAF